MGLISTWGPLSCRQTQASQIFSKITYSAQIVFDSGSMYRLVQNNSTLPQTKILGFTLGKLNKENSSQFHFSFPCGTHKNKKSIANNPFSHIT